MLGWSVLIGDGRGRLRELEPHLVSAKAVR